MEYQEFLENRPENRLIRLALEKVSRLTQQDENRRLVQELLFALDDVPPSSHVAADLRSWSTDRNSRHYQAVFEFTRLIVLGQTPYATHGASRFTSLVFPMEDVYEKYVLELLYTTLPDWKVEAQVGREHLARLSGQKKFQLLLDVLLTRGDTQVVLDTKWKRLDQREEGRWIKPADKYQMHAYASTYLKTQPRKRVFLLYPRTSGFRWDVGPYALEGGIEVFALSVDLSSPDPLKNLRTHLLELPRTAAAKWLQCDKNCRVRMVPWLHGAPSMQGKAGSGLEDVLLSGVRHALRCQCSHQRGRPPCLPGPGVSFGIHDIPVSK